MARQNQQAQRVASAQAKTRPHQFRGSLRFPTEDTPRVTDTRIQVVLDLLLKESYGRRPQTSEIAAAVNLSPSYLCHLFKQQVGMSPAQYVKRLRLQRAKELVETTFLSVKQVMCLAGFSDLSHFVRDYKASFGLTPTQARAVASTKLSRTGARKIRQ